MNVKVISPTGRPDEYRIELEDGEGYKVIDGKVRLGEMRRTRAQLGALVANGHRLTGNVPPQYHAFAVEGWSA